jgi:mitochondrial fission protein ELM1
MSEFSAVVGTGSGTFYAVKTVAGKNGLKSVAMLYPRGYRLGGFDLVLSPAFDRPRKLPNVVEIPANLVAVDEEFYARGTEEFLKRHQPCKPAVAVVVGGPNKCSSMTGDWMRRQLEKIFAENPGCEFWVTTSRRTPAEVERTVEEFPFDYRLIYSKDRFNPIPAFVKSARRLYVTAESTGMLSEACTFGEAEVKVLDNLNADGGKFRVFVDGLIAAGYVGGSRKIDLSAEMARARVLLGV